MTTTRPMAHTLAIMISNGVSGITNKCSIGAVLALADQRRAGQDD